MEVEVKNKLPFLDVCVERDRNVLKTTVFRKKTHTGQYLNFQSNHQKSVKEGVAYSLFDRAKSLCSNNDDLKVEIQKIEQDLVQNGYPQNIIKKCKKARERKSKESNQEDRAKAFMSIPYVPGLSEKIRRVGRKFNIRTAFKTQNTLRQSLVKTKPRNGTQESKNCVYSIKCSCSREYIGETKRPLNVRIKEHKENTKKGLTEKSKIAQHCWSENHNMLWDEASIIHREPHFYKRKVIEASYIKLADQPISQSSVEIRPLWLPVLKNELKRREPKPLSNNQDKIAKRCHQMTLRTKTRPEEQNK
jgi:predicted GIY-YIG superfamily endonuclease/uncharacterized protein (UPF0335 family)